MILVTGGTGFLGSHLLLFLLRKDLKVRAIYKNPLSLQKTKHLFSLYHPNPQELFNKIEWMHADITNITELDDIFEGIDQVYHTAAIVDLGGDKEKKMELVNVEGTKNMLQFSIDHKVKKFLHVSSIAALGSYETPITEKTYWSWKENSGIYAKTKFLSEMEVWRATQEGLDVVIINPSVIMGAGFWEEGTGKIFRKIDKGMRFYTGGGSGFVDVWDVVKAMFQLMESPITNESFIVSAENLSYKYLLDKIADSLQKKKPNIELKPWMFAFIKPVNLISRLIWRKNIIDPSLIQSLFSNTQYSSDKLIKALDFQFIPMEISIRNIAEKYIRENRQT
jgi:nucleoside-diphosphate-sugar epimerase